MINISIYIYKYIHMEDLEGEKERDTHEITWLLEDIIFR